MTTPEHPAIPVAVQVVAHAAIAAARGKPIAAVAVDPGVSGFQTRRRPVLTMGAAMPETLNRHISRRLRRRRHRPVHPTEGNHQAGSVRSE